MKRTKITSLVLSLALILSSFFCLSSAIKVDAAAETASAPEIISYNIAYQGNFGLVIAVEAATVKGGSVTIKIYDDDKTTVLKEYTQTETEQITLNGETKTVYAVKSAGIAAKDMAKQYYFNAVDADNNAGKLMRYSVAEYCYSRLYLGTCTASQAELYESILKMGASAQKVLVNEKDGDTDTSNDVTLVTDYKFITVEGGKLSDGYRQGVYENGTVTLTPDSGTPAWKVTNLVTKAETIETSNTFTVSSHVEITAVENTETPFEKGQGIYFNQYKSSSLVYDNLSSVQNDLRSPGKAVVYDGNMNRDNETATKDSGYAAGLYFSQLDGSDKALTFRTQPDPTNNNGNVNSFVFAPMNEASGQTAYVFESDIRFSAPTSTVNAVSGRNVFAFEITDGYFNTNYAKNSDFNDVQGSCIQQVSDGTTITGYTIHNNALAIDTWYNIRITYDTATGAYEVFLNDVSIYTETYAVASVEGLAVYDNGRYVGGNITVQFDNTYLGTYGEAAPSEPDPEPEVFVKGTGEYFTKYASSSYTWDGYSNFSEINANPVYRAGDGSVSQNAAENATSAELTGDTDKAVLFRLGNTTASSSTAPTIHFRLFENDTSATTYVFESDIFLNSVVAGSTANLSSGRFVFGLDFGNSYASSATPANNAATTAMKSEAIYNGKTTSGLSMLVTDGALTGYSLHNHTLDLDTWYNLRITFDTAAKAYNVYINGEVIYTTTIDTITAVTGLTVGVNVACGGSLGIQFDNTYCGTDSAQ